MKRTFALLLALLLLLGALAACKPTGSDGELKKGTIEKTDPAGNTDVSGWQPLTTAARAELDAIYEQKVAGTKAFATVPAATGTTYYISSIHGNDNNDGKSPATAWASPTKANSNVIKRGDAVLFECGSVFRRTGSQIYIYIKSGVTYATYGSGEKPIFYGSINASGASNWKKVDGKSNVYYYKETITQDKDVGAIIFNNGEAWGIKVQMTYKGRLDTNPAPAYKTLALTDVSNGLQTGLTVPEYDLRNGKDLKGPDLSFYHDVQYVYLYCEGGNPGTRFSSIEIALPGYAFIGSNVTDVSILNLDFRYFADHVVRPSDCRNFTVKNCSFFFVGGTILQDFGGWRNYYTRLGDAIENWDSCDGMVIENCYFDQVYDTPMTTQSTSAVDSKNITYRNNVVLNTWYGVELWTTDDGVEFSNVDISGNYFGKLGEGLTTQRPDKIDPGISYPINGFIEFGSKNHTMTNCSATGNIVDGTTACMIYCLQLQTKDNANGFLFDNNTYVGIANTNYFGHFYDRLKAGTRYAYTASGIETIQSLGVEEHGTFYYVRETADGNAVDRVIDSLPLYTYKAANGVSLPFRVFLPEGYSAGGSYSLVTYLNMESASGNDNLQNVMASKKLISKLVEEDNAIILVPQCPSGTWTGIAVDTGNYSTASVAETDVMKAVAALIRDAATEFHANRKYAVGVDAGAYAVSDLLVRHKDLVAAGVIIAGAGDPNASVGNAKVMIIHAEHDDEIPYENAEELAEAWGAEYKLIDDFQQMHDCWDYVAENEDILGWLLSK